MGKLILGIIVGIVAALAGQAVIDLIANQIFPSPPVNIWNKTEVEAVFAARPAGAFVLMAVGYFAGALLGAYLAKLISRRSWTAWVPVGILTLFALVVAVSYPVPVWAKIAIVIAPILAGLVAQRLRVATDEGVAADANA